MIDFHSHLMPAVDDGAQSIDDARAALEKMREQGVKTVITTPHLQGTVTEDAAQLEAFFARVDPAWEELAELARAEFPDLDVRRGLEVMLDTPTPNLEDERIRLSGSPYVLVEFPYMRIPPNCTQVLFELKVKGWKPIIAHPERYQNFSDVEDADEWRSVGALLQLNSGSFLGKYGKTAESLAWSLLENGWADFLSSDYHTRGRLHVAECRAMIEDAGGKEIVRLLTEINPQLMLNGEETEAVPPFQRKRSLFGRLLGR